MSDSEMFRFRDGRGQEVTRDVNLTLDIRDFEDKPGYPWLFLAANAHLSYDVMLRYLESKGARLERTKGWLQRRRWMFEPANAVNGPGVKANADGKEARAIAMVRANATLSAAKLSRLLAESGIRRSREWVRRNRCR